ncbi:MAG: SMP-30/gluconolactonase/LRE family protein [Pontibacterium sp.]
MKNLFKTVLVTAVFAASGVQAAEQAWQATGFAQPESALYSADLGYIYVSNIEGHPLEADGKGFISRVKPTGEVESLRWAEGLDAPKGLAIFEGFLYVADLTQVVKIDLMTGEVVHRYKASEAKMLNDIAVSEAGELFVTDFVGQAIYRFGPETELTLWQSGADLHHPNGLLWHEGELWVAAWGKEMQPDFTTKAPGHIYRFNTETGKRTAYEGKNVRGNLDGLTLSNDQLYVSDWIKGEVYRVTPQGLELEVKQPSGTADIGSAKGLILVPEMWEGRVTAWASQ